MANKLWRVSYMFELIESPINMCTQKFEASNWCMGSSRMVRLSESEEWKKINKTNIRQKISILLKTEDWQVTQKMEDLNSKICVIKCPLVLSPPHIHIYIYNDGWVCFSVTVWSFLSQTILCTREQPQSIYNKPNVQPTSPWFSSLAFKFKEIDRNINPMAPTSETGTYKLRNQWAGNALFAFYRVNKIQRRSTIQNPRGIKWEMTKISKQQNNDQGMKSYAW